MIYKMKVCNDNKDIDFTLIVTSVENCKKLIVKGKFTDTIKEMCENTPNLKRLEKQFSGCGYNMITVYGGNLSINIDEVECVHRTDLDEILINELSKKTFNESFGQFKLDKGYFQYCIDDNNLKIFKEINSVLGIPCKSIHAEMDLTDAEVTKILATYKESEKNEMQMSIKECIENLEDNEDKIIDLSNNIKFNDGLDD